MYNIETSKYNWSVDTIIEGTKFLCSNDDVVIELEAFLFGDEDMLKTEIKSVFIKQDKVHSTSNRFKRRYKGECIDIGTALKYGKHLINVDKYFAF